MFVYPEPDPIAFSIGPLDVHWYGLMYLLSFLIGWGLAVYRTRLSHIRWHSEEVGDYLFYVVLGVVIGGRLGYMVFYQPDVLISDPLQVFFVWQGGMSFHGGLIGVLVASAWFARKTGRTFFDVTDFVAPIVPVGLFFGRIGNFINGELVGRVTDVPWAMIYPHVDYLPGGPLPRHPSQIYEALLEGVVLFAILWWFSSKPRPRMAVSGLFLLGYGGFRFFLEFFRLPDPMFIDPGQQLGFVAFGWMTMGQLLSLPMIAFGALFLVMAYTRKERRGA